MAARQGLAGSLTQSAEDARRSLLNSRAVPASVRGSSWLSNLNTTCTIKSAPPRTPEVMTLLSTKSGWLVKRNEQHVWQRRWCCVVPHMFLYYFESCPPLEQGLDGGEDGTSAGDGHNHPHHHHHHADVSLSMGGGGGVGVVGATPDHDELNAAVRDGLKSGGGAGPRSGIPFHSSSSAAPTPTSSGGVADSPGGGGEAAGGTGTDPDHLDGRTSPSPPPHPPMPPSSASSNLQPVGIIDLECYSTIQRSRTNATVLELSGDPITNPDLRSFYFQASSVDDAEKWTNALLSDRHTALVDEVDAYRQVCDAFPIQLQQCFDKIDDAEEKAAACERECYSVRSQAEEGRRKVASAVRESLERRQWTSVASVASVGGGGGGGGEGMVDEEKMERLPPPPPPPPPPPLANGRGRVGGEDRQQLQQHEPPSKDENDDAEEDDDDGVAKLERTKLEARRTELLLDLDATYSGQQHHVPSASTSPPETAESFVHILSDYVDALTASHDALVDALRLTKIESSNQRAAYDRTVDELKGALRQSEANRVHERSERDARISDLTETLHRTQSELTDAHRHLDGHRMEFGMYQSSTKSKLSELNTHKKILKKEVIELRKKIDDMESDKTAYAHENDKLKTKLESERERYAVLERYVDKIERQVNVQQNMMEMMSQGGGGASFVGRSVGPGCGGNGGGNGGGGSVAGRESFDGDDGSYSHHHNRPSSPPPPPSSSSASGHYQQHGSSSRSASASASAAPLLPPSPYGRPPPEKTSGAAPHRHHAYNSNNNKASGASSSMSTSTQSQRGRSLASSGPSSSSAGGGGGGAVTATTATATTVTTTAATATTASGRRGDDRGAAGGDDDGERDEARASLLPSNIVTSSEEVVAEEEDQDFADIQHGSSATLQASSSSSRRTSHRQREGGGGGDDPAASSRSHAVVAPVAPLLSLGGDGGDETNAKKEQGGTGGRGSSWNAIQQPREEDEKEPTATTAGGVARLPPVSPNRARSNNRNNAGRLSVGVDLGGSGGAGGGGGVGPRGPISPMKIMNISNALEGGIRSDEDDAMLDDDDDDDDKSRVSELTEDRTQRQIEDIVERRERMHSSGFADPSRRGYGAEEVDRPYNQSSSGQRRTEEGRGGVERPSSSAVEDNETAPPRYILGVGSSPSSAPLSPDTRSTPGARQEQQQQYSQLGTIDSVPHSFSSVSDVPAAANAASHRGSSTGLSRHNQLQQQQEQRRGSGHDEHSVSMSSLGSFGSATGGSKLSVAQRARMEADAPSAGVNTVRAQSPLRASSSSRDENRGRSKGPRPFDAGEGQRRSSSGPSRRDSSGKSFFSSLSKKLEDAIDNSVLGVELEGDDGKWKDDEAASETTASLKDRAQQQREQQLAFLKQQGLLKEGDEGSVRGGAGATTPLPSPRWSRHQSSTSVASATGEGERGGARAGGVGDARSVSSLNRGGSREFASGHSVGTR